MTTQIQTAMDMYWATNVLSADPPIVWDTFKAVSRGECISAIKAARRDHNAECEILLAKERECAKLQADSPSESNYASLFSDIGVQCHLGCHLKLSFYNSSFAIYLSQNVACDIDCSKDVCSIHYLPSGTRGGSGGISLGMVYSWNPTTD